MSDFFTASTATPPKRAVRRVTRTDRQSVDSTSSLASTDIQTPDRATFPRFTSAAVEAGPSCFRSARTAGAEAEGDVETVWDDMEAGGLLEVKIGSLLDLTPRMSACYLRPISPSSDLAFEQDYEVQPDDSPLLPPTYISPRQNVAPVPIPHFALPVRAPVHLASTPSGSGKRVRPRNRPSTADTAPIPFGARPHAPPPSAGMSRTSSENLDVRSQGLGIDFGPSTHPARRVESKRCSRSSHDREEILSITDYPYLGRLSFGGSHLSIPSFLSDPATTEHHAYAGKDKGKGKMQEPERDRDQGKGYGREGISRGSHPSLPLTPPSAGLANFNNHFRTPSSSSSFTASSIRTTGSTTSNRSGPPRSIPSRTSSRQQDTRPPPALAFAPPPRSSSLAVIARPTSISQPQQRQANRYSCASVVSVISDHSDIAPPLPASTSNFRLLPPAIPSRSYIPNKARRQAIYLSRTTSHPLEETLATFTESRDLEDSPTGAWSLRPSAPHAPLRRSRSSPCIRSNNCNDDSHDMSLRSKSGLRESQSFLMPKAGIPSHGSMKRFSRRLQKSPPAPPVPPKDRSTQPPSPGSPFKSRASRLGLSDLWGGKLHPQGIMHIASTSRSRAELHSLDSSGSLSTAPSLNLDMGPGLDIDLDLDLTDRPLPCSETFRSVEGPTSTSTSTEARSIRMSNAAALAAARKARIVASGGKGEVYNPYDYAVADILAEVEAEDEEYVLYLADRAEDLVAWKEAQGWDWPEPPYRPIGPLDTVGTVVEIRVDNAESVGRDGTPSKAGMPVRAPRFLTTRPKGLGPEAKRNTRQARRETGTEGKRDSAGSQGATSMKSAGTSSSLAETAILTPESIHPSTANDYIEARLSTASQKHKGEKAPMLFADSIVSSLCPSAAPTIHVDCPTTPTPSTLPLGPEMGIDNDITPKAPSRSDSLRDMAHATADPGSLKLTALNDADTGTTQRYMSIRYGSTSSLPLPSIPDTSASYILNDLSNRHATAASNADPGSVGVATEVGRERQYSVIRAWKNKRKLEKQAAAELKAKARADLSLAAEANFASMPVPMPTPTPALPSSSAAELAAKPTQNAKEKEGARGKEDKAQQGPGKKAGSAGKAAGRMLWTAMSYGSDLRV